MIRQFIWYSVHLLFGGLVSCGPAATSLTLTPLPTLQPRPSFVLEVAPEEGAIVPFAIFKAGHERISLNDIRMRSSFENITAYESHVCLRVRSIAQAGDDFTQDSVVASRVTMFVDGVQIETLYAGQADLSLTSVTDINTGEVIMRGIDPKIICGQIDLAPGVHEVFFQFRQTSGDVLEYRWQFELVED